MKVLIQGLGEVPIPITLSLRKLKPDIAYILCSEYQLNYVHPKFEKPNRDVIAEAARKLRINLVFKRCNVFNPKSIRDCLVDILKCHNVFEDELMFNYTSGSAPVRLFLGVLGVQLSHYTKKSHVYYTIHYNKEKVKIVKDHGGPLREFLPADIDLLLEVCLRRPKRKKSQR